MSRATDTRQRVREIADQMVSKGQKPTPTTILAILGKGSPNTIVSELKAWNLEKTDSSEPLKSETAQKGPTEPGQAAANREPSNEETDFESVSLNPKLHAIFSQIESLSTQVSQLSSRIANIPAPQASPLDIVESGMKAIEARFDGLNKYMLMQINEAREDSIRWRDKYRLVREELGQWQTVLRQKLDSVNTENAWLKGRLNENKGEPVSSELPPIKPPIAKPQMYSGHPRATVSDEFNSQE